MSQMSNWTSLFGGGAVPIGAIVQGQFAADNFYLPCDGGDYLKAAYPNLDTTQLETFGSNTLTARSIGRTGLTSVAFGNGGAGGLFVATTVGQNTCLTSPDGVTWTSRALPGVAYSLLGTSVVFGNGLFVVLNYAGGVVYTSPDGITWTQRAIPAPPASQWAKVGFANNLFFVFLTKNANQSVLLTSPDGITWTQRSTSVQNPWDVIYANGQYICASGGQASTTTSYYGVSVDAVNWRTASMTDAVGTAVSGQWESVASFANKLLMLSPGSLPRVSSDGAIFTTLMLPYGGGTYQAMRVFNGRLYLLGSSTAGANQNMAVTTDLVNWKFYTWAQTEGAVDAAFGNNTLVVGNLGQSGIVNTVSSLSIDTTKFRTPLMPKVGDGDRFYIRAR